MKTAFPGYYAISEKELRNLWNSCLFVLDTNVLLDVYRLSEKSSEELFSALKNLEKKLWVHYHASKEYHSRLYSTIKEQVKKYDDAIGIINKLQQLITTKRSHPFLPNDKIQWFNDFCQELTDQLNIQKTNLHNLLLQNDKKDKLATLLCNKINKKPTDAEMEKIHQEGQRRYDNNIPPGYKDKNNKENPHGDYIIWNEIIQQAISNNTDIIFITNDKKEDWFLSIDGLTICVRPELIEEFQERTKHKIQIYQLDSFLHHLSLYTEITVDPTVIAEIKEQQQYNREEIMESIDNQDIITQSTDESEGISMPTENSIENTQV